MIRYYFTHFEPIDDIYIPHYVTHINTERKSINDIWRTEIEVSEDYAETAEDWMWNTDDIVEFAQV